MVIEAANAVGQTVTDQVSLTEKFLNNFRTFAETRGIDIAEAIIVFIIGYIICREIKKWVKHLLGKSNIDPTAIGFITEMIYFISLVIVLVISLEVAGLSTSSLVAALGGMGIAIGLALQDNFSNVASGIFILLFRPFNVGDYISAVNIEGTVVEISIMYTRLQTLGNQMIVIPNKTITGNIIKNYSHFNLRNLELTVDVSYDTPLPQCLELLKKVLAENPYVQNKENVTLHISEMADYSIRIYTRCEVNTSEYFAARTDIFIKIKEAFDRVGIEMPYPQVVVHHTKE